MKRDPFRRFCSSAYFYDGVFELKRRRMATAVVKSRSHSIRRMSLYDTEIMQRGRRRATATVCD